MITLNYYGKIVNFKTLLQFQRKRFLRLYPLHASLLMLFVLLEISKYYFIYFTNININNEPFSGNNSVESLIANLFLIQAWSVESLSFNFPSWSVSAGFYTYLLFGCFLFFTQFVKFVEILLISVIFCFGILLFNQNLNFDNYSGVLRCIYSFTIGTVIFFIYKRSKIKLKSSMIGLILIISTTYLLTQESILLFEKFILFPILFGLIIFSLLITSEKSALIKTLNNKYLLFLGTISYGIYMIHMFVWVALSIFLNRLIGIEYTYLDDGSCVLLLDNIYMSNVIHILGMFVIIFAAHISHKYFESIFYKV